MENKQTKNFDTISLIGPACAGKTLLANELSKQTGLQVISLDDLIYLIKRPILFIKLPSKLLYKAYKNITLSNLISGDCNFKKGTAEYQKQLENIDRLFGEFLLYKKLLGNLGAFRRIYYDVLSNYNIFSNDPLNSTMVYKDLFNELLSELLPRLKQPAILDVGAFFGWETPNHLKSSDDFKLNPTDIDKKSKQLVSQMGTVVLLEPGQDYAIRNSEKKWPANELTINYLDYFHENADVIVSTNGLFFDPENHLDAFKTRNTFNSADVFKREAILNKGEIANICSQIIECRQSLQNAQQKQ